MTALDLPHHSPKVLFCSQVQGETFTDIDPALPPKVLGGHQTERGLQESKAAAWLKDVEGPCIMVMQSFHLQGFRGCILIENPNSHP